MNEKSASHSIKLLLRVVTESQRLFEIEKFFWGKKVRERAHLCGFVNAFLEEGLQSRISPLVSQRCNFRDSKPLEIYHQLLLEYFKRWGFIWNHYQNGIWRPQRESNPCCRDENPVS